MNSSPNSRLASLAAAASISLGGLLVAASSLAQGTAVDKTALLTASSYAISVQRNGVDISANTPVASVKYGSDGSDVRTLKDGKQVPLTWRFINPAQTQLETVAPGAEGTQRWVVLELTDKVFRKANMETGLVVIHTAMP
jgi:hypothetical protein